MLLRTQSYVNQPLVTLGWVALGYSVALRTFWAGGRQVAAANSPNSQG